MTRALQHHRGALLAAHNHATTAGEWERHGLEHASDAHHAEAAEWMAGAARSWHAAADALRAPANDTTTDRDARLTARDLLASYRERGAAAAAMARNLGYVEVTR